MFPELLNDLYFLDFFFFFFLRQYCYLFCGETKPHLSSYYIRPGLILAFLNLKFGSS